MTLAQTYILYVLKQKKEKNKTKNSIQIVWVSTQYFIGKCWMAYFWGSKSVFYADAFSLQIFQSFNLASVQSNAYRMYNVVQE